MPNLIKCCYLHAIYKGKELYSAEEYYSYFKNTNKDQKKNKFSILEFLFTFFACLIFFFIGAPLGAIIRKGGLGTPVVVSVLLFIVYYIIDIRLFFC
jgi:lipopolysaccharide export LptBFGC system permease protein LptF